MLFSTLGADMTRPSRTGGKKSEAKTRNAHSAKGHKTTKAKRRIAPVATRTKRRLVAKRKTSTKNRQRKGLSLAELREQLERCTNELAEARAQQTATAEVLGVINSSPAELTPVFDTILQKAHALCGVAFGSLQLYDGQDLRAVATHAFSDRFASLLRKGYRADQSFVARLLLKGDRVVHVSDAANADFFLLRAAAELEGMRTVLFVPLRKEGELLGIIVAARRERRLFSEREIRLLENFAAQAVIAIENARLLNETREALERQTATSDVLEVISSSPGDMKPVFEAILSNALRICEAKFGHLLMYDGHSFHATHLHDVPPSYREYWEEHAPICPAPNTGLGRLARSKEVAHIPDLKADSAYAEREPLRVVTVEQAGARSFLAVPMLKESKLIGAIVIYRKEVRPFTDKQIEVIRNFAAQAVIAIENARLLHELRESLQQQTATANVLEVISRSAFDLKPVFETVAESSVKLCGSERALILRFDGELLRVTAAYNAPHDLLDWLQRNPTPPGRHSVGARAALERRTVHVSDVRADPEHTYGAKDVWPFRTVLGVPMLKGDDLLGVILVYHNEVRQFTERQIALVETFADQAVIAIENVRLFDEVRARTEDLREALQFQTATSDVLKVISRSPDALQPVLDAIVETSRLLCGSDASTIFSLRERKFYVTAVSGIAPAHLEFLQNNPASLDQHDSVLPRVAREKRTLHYPNIFDDPELKQGYSGVGGPRALLVVPLMNNSEVTGAIVLRQSHLKPFTQRQIELVQTFADQAVIAISNVNLFEQVQERSQELSQSLDDLRTAQDRLVQTEKLASLGQLTAGIAHEIKNPLNFVNNFSAISAELVGEMNEMLAKASLDTAMRGELDDLTHLLKSNLEKVVQHGKRADSIVKNMLQHSREGSGEHQPADINAIVDESLNLAYHGARAEKTGFSIAMQRDLDSTVGLADVYPQEITRVLLNLISNGFYAATKRRADADDGFEPTLIAATKNLGDKVEIRIRDNGAGIPEGVKDKIFNPFFTTKPPGEGTGLGLSMSHDIIVKQHGGSIDVETEPGLFTEFRIVLPRTGHR
jgi:two-component system, NtrC family, sensor kinase